MPTASDSQMGCLMLATLLEGMIPTNNYHPLYVATFRRHVGNKRDGNLCECYARRFHGHGMRIDWKKRTYVAGAWTDGKLTRVAEFGVLHAGLSLAGQNENGVLLDLHTALEATKGATDTGNNADAARGDPADPQAQAQATHTDCIRSHPATTFTVRAGTTSKFVAEMSLLSVPAQARSKAATNKVRPADKQETIMFGNGDYFVGAVAPRSQFDIRTWERGEISGSGARDNAHENGAASFFDPALVQPLEQESRTKKSQRAADPLLPHGVGVLVLLGTGGVTDNAYVWGEWEAGQLVQVFQAAGTTEDE